MKIKKRKKKPILKRARIPAEAAARTGFRKFTDPVVRRWKLIAAATGALALVAAGVGGYLYYRHDRELRAARAYGHVRTKIEDMVRAEMEKQGEGARIDETKINAAAQAEMQSLIERYGDTDAGQTAKYELASIYFDQGKYEEAGALFAQVEKDASGLAAVLAAKGVADCHRAVGDYDAAIAKYKRLFEEHKGEFPAVPVAMDLADCYRRTGRAEEAVKLYRYVVDYHRLSPYAGKAEMELAKAEAEAAAKEKPR
jgi:tetratricopeptide (TPR) repeat protein